MAENLEEWGVKGSERGRGLTEPELSVILAIVTTM